MPTPPQSDALESEQVAIYVDLPELSGSANLRAAGLKLFTLLDFAGHRAMLE